MVTLCHAEVDSKVTTKPLHEEATRALGLNVFLSGGCSTQQGADLVPKFG